MTDSEITFYADTSALRAEIRSRAFEFAFAIVMVAVLATHVPIAATVVLSVALAGWGIAAFPSGLRRAASGREPILALGPEGVAYLPYGDHRVPWAQIDEALLDVVSEERLDKARSARRLPKQDRFILTLKPHARRIWRRRIVIVPHYLAVDLETLVAAIETHSGRKVSRIEWMLPPSAP